MNRTATPPPTDLEPPPDSSRPRSGKPPTGAFYRLGQVIGGHALLMLAITVAVFVPSAILGVGAFGRLLSGGFDNPSSASSKAAVLMDRHFGGQPNLIFLVHARTGTVDSPAATASGAALATKLSDDPRLSAVTSYWSTRAPALRSTDGSDALILTHVVGTTDQATTTATSILSDYANQNTSAVTVRIGGSLGTGINTQVTKDLALAESIAVPLTLVLLLLLAFGSVVAALLPLSIGLLAIVVTLAELNVLTHVTSVSIFAINLTTALGLGLGIDYALLMVSRFREELARGVDVREAVARTTATAGRTIAFSALTVAAALSAMLVFPVYFLRSFAYAGVGVTLFAALSALVVLPALLSVLGHRVNSGRIPGVKIVRSPEAPFWGHLAKAVMRRPALAAVPVVAVLLFLAVPLLHVSFATPDDRALPAGSASHQVGDALRTDFATQPSEIDILIRPALPATTLASYTQHLSTLTGVQVATSSAGTFATGHPTSATVSSAMTVSGIDRLTISTNLQSTSGAAQQLVTQIRNVATPNGATALVGGDTATLLDDKTAISSRLLLAAAIISITTFILLFLFTGSIVQPIRALLGNILTLGATLGTMVWIFQDGHFASFLGFTPTPTDTAMPVLLFCIAFGLSMDYEVFLMSRIKELHDGGASNADAVTGGLARTGRIVSTAAALLAVSFFAFATSHVSFIQLFGLGTGMAILIDATLVRGVLVPAFMRTFGENSWYAPAPMRRLHNRIGLSDNASTSQLDQDVRLARV